MEYIRPNDYDYIIKKYNGERFARCDELFSEASGMAPDLLLSGLKVNDEFYAAQSRPVRKARAMEFVLKNTRISCDARDRFPAINMIDRPLNFLFWAWRSELFGEIIPEVEAVRFDMEKKGIATCWPDFDHSVPDWDRLFSLGFKGILDESEKARISLQEKAPLTDEQTAFFDGIKITYEAIIEFLGRLSARAEAEGQERMALAFSNLQKAAPTTFYEALLFDYIYFMLSEHIDALQVRSLCNFDRLLYPLYKSDLESGVTETELRTDLAYFFMQFTSMNNYWNQPVFLGGCKEDESTEINELSYMFLDVYDKMGIFNPKVQIKIADSTPKDIILKALDMIRRGNNSIVFVSDATIRKALMRSGATAEQARLCNVKGCYEYSVQGSYGTGMNYVNLLKPLEYAMHEGKDAVSGEFSGNASPSIESYTTFEGLYNEYKRQLKNVIDRVIDTVNSFEDYLYTVNPLSMLSATYSSCLESGRDAIGGGSISNGSNMMFGYVANLADSFSNIKKYVFDEKRLTLKELRDMIDKNFEGNEKWQQIFRADRNKFGNNKDIPDAFAKDIVDFLAVNTCGRPNSKLRGGKWTCGFHNARMSYTQGYVTAASADGRSFGEELSKNMSAQIGMNREGATAAILSTTKIDATAFPGDACLDLGLLPSAVKGEDGLDAMYGLLMTFINRGGHAMHINVFDAETLRDAQKHPEKYQDLQIRVSGWNVLFNNINKEEQDGFIRQAEGLI